MLRLAHADDFEPNRAHFGELIDPATGERIDEVVVTFFAKPHSYTTDDVVEISCHGSPVVLRHVVRDGAGRAARGWPSPASSPCAPSSTDASISPRPKRSAI